MRSSASNSLTAGSWTSVGIGNRSCGVYFMARKAPWKSSQCRIICATVFVVTAGNRLSETIFEVEKSLRPNQVCIVLPSLDQAPTFSRGDIAMVGPLYITMATVTQASTQMRDSTSCRCNRGIWGFVPSLRQEIVHQVVETDTTVVSPVHPEPVVAQVAAGDSLKNRYTRNTAGRGGCRSFADLQGRRLPPHSIGGDQFKVRVQGDSELDDSLFHPTPHPSPRTIHRSWSGTMSTDSMFNPRKRNDRYQKLRPLRGCGVAGRSTHINVTRCEHHDVGRGSWRTKSLCGVPGDKAKLFDAGTPVPPHPQHSLTLSRCLGTIGPEFNFKSRGG